MHLHLGASALDVGITELLQTIRRSPLRPPDRDRLSNWAATDIKAKKGAKNKARGENAS